MSRQNHIWVLVGLTSPAAAFELERSGEGAALRWSGDQVVYAIETQGMPTTTGGEPADAIRNAFATWDSLGTELHFAEEEPTGVREPEEVTGNGRNEVLWPTYWDDAPERLAHTLVRYGGDDSILEADILLNPDVRWAVLEDPESAPDTGERLHDVQNVVAHEIGHFLGLAHSELGDATMYASSYPGEVEKRDLSLDDVSGYEFLYEAGLESSSGDEPIGSTPAAGLGCSAAPSSAAEGSPLALLLVVGLGLWMARKRPE